MSEIFPEEWDRPEDKEAVIILLINLDVDPRNKKFALYEWCEMHGIEMTGRDVERVTGRPAGEI